MTVEWPQSKAALEATFVLSAGGKEEMPGVRTSRHQEESNIKERGSYKKGVVATIGKAASAGPVPSGVGLN